MTNLCFFRYSLFIQAQHLNFSASAYVLLLQPMPVMLLKAPCQRQHSRFYI